MTIVPIPARGANTLRRCPVGTFTVTEAVHPAGSVLPPHAHATGTISLPLAGGFTERAGRDPSVMVRSGAVFRCAGCTHENVFDGAGAHALHLDGLDGLDGMSEPEWLHAVSVRLPVLALALRGELWRDDPSAVLARECLVEEIVAEVRSAVAHPRDEAGSPSWLRAAAEILHDRSREHLAIADVALEVGVHRVTLAREFRRRLGTTPGHYLRRVRLHKALRAIALERQPLSRAALQAGFYDQSHLARWLRREAGTTPGRVSAAPPACAREVLRDIELARPSGSMPA